MSNPIAVFAVESDMDYLVPGNHAVNNSGLRWLLNELPVEEDEELGIEEVRVAVKACPDGTLFDVLLNDLSVGYFAIQAYCQCVPGLKMPTRLALWEESKLDLAELLDASDYGIYIVPMFGEAVPC
jgi:hypothetical protein